MERQTPKKKPIKEVEKQLVPRLKLMGYCMFFFSALSLSYATISKDYQPTPEEMLLPVENERAAGIFGPIKSPFLTVTKQERKKCLILAALFGGVGASCFIITNRKKKEFDREQH